MVRVVADEALVSPLGDLGSLERRDHPATNKLTGRSVAALGLVDKRNRFGKRADIFVRQEAAFSEALNKVVERKHERLSQFEGCDAAPSGHARKRIQSIPDVAILAGMRATYSSSNGYTLLLQWQKDILACQEASWFNLCGCPAEATANRPPLPNKTLGPTKAGG